MKKNVINECNLSSKFFLCRKILINFNLPGIPSLPSRPSCPGSPGGPRITIGTVSSYSSSRPAIYHSMIGSIRTRRNQLIENKKDNYESEKDTKEKKDQKITFLLTHK